MNTTTTFNDLILFAYNETNLLDTVRVKQSIENNFEVGEQFNELVSTMESIDTALAKMLDPGSQSVDVILRYSKMSAGVRAFDNFCC